MRTATKYRWALALVVGLGTHATAAAALKVCQARKVDAPPAAVRFDTRLGPAAIADFRNAAAGPAAVQTRAAAFYDNKRIYFVIECAEPRMDKLVAKVKPQPKDAYVFSDDCVEVFIRPQAASKQYYHFVANALGARFDEKVKDKGWTADWTARVTKSADRWTLRVVIPFAALGARPTADSVWRVNVCRQRQAGGKLELSAWSPTGTNFHDLSKFGVLLFGSDYAACIANAVVKPWTRRAADLRQRAKIDPAAAQRLDERLQAIAQDIAPVARAAKQGGISISQFAHLLTTGEAALKRIDDAAQQLDDAVRRLEVVAAMKRLAPPAKKLLVYATRAITNRQILPAPEPPKNIVRKLAVRACRGEYEPASFVVYPLETSLTLDVSATKLEGPAGSIDPSAVDIRAVKRWYQSGAGGRFPINRGQRILTPELLLKDDALVRVDHEKKENYVKLKFPDGRRKWLWISSTKTTLEERKISVKDQPIYDAKALRPVRVPRHTAKQFWVTVHVPANAAFGTYRGKIELRAGGKLIEALPLELDVLAFDLAPNPLESSVYFHWGINLDVRGEGTVRHATRSVAQYRAELANLLAHGVDNPTMGVRFETGLLGLALWLRQEVGMKNDHLYYLIARTSLPPDTIKQIIRVAKQFGFEDVYFYGVDEARGDRLKAQRAVWERVHAAGGKVFVAGTKGNFPLVVDLQDLLVCYGTPSKEVAAKWHSKGHKIFCYANPQSGIEEPETYRRNFGLLLAANDYDGGMTYIYYHGWNDFNGKRYRQHDFVYPTADGVIDTVQWEGYREGIDDLRYLGTLRQAIARAQQAGPAAARLAAQAQHFADTMDVSGDLYALREQMIEWIVKLQRSCN